MALDTFDSPLPEDWAALLGTWNTTAGALDGGGSSGRIVKPLPAPCDRFTFSYRTSHDPANPATFDTEYYALAVLRSDPAGAA